ncbi:hypothetical protein ES319_D01G043900v1 [Gossypium barbadense]|uniref:Uncharacterized protein n=1 Tax=Gossypium barbadense TaxID=3634 RepID=A0A5J5SJR0_GOSBA|nr:hypothetical protein ES319_D01G043900v1 [Gossypium barbadense]
MWSLWFHRNLFAWQSKNASTAHILAFSVSFMQDWNDPGAVSGVVGSCWSKPPMEWVKCNINATLFREANAAGWSAVVRDAKGSC